MVFVFGEMGKMHVYLALADAWWDDQMQSRRVSGHSVDSHEIDGAQRGHENRSRTNESLIGDKATELAVWAQVTPLSQRDVFDGKWLRVATRNALNALVRIKNVVGGEI